MITDTLATLVEGSDLSRDTMVALMESIMTGGATPAQIGAALTALRIKGETVTEIAAAAEVMRNLAAKVEVSATHLVDLCGTGGSGTSKFNVSTASALVAAGAGIQVAKHGNRAASGKSGSADVLEAAGVHLDLTPAQVGQCIETVGVGFLFALNHHGAMRHAIGPRKELKFRTMFNLLGPLTNPAGTKRQVLGVFDAAWLWPLAEVLRELGSEQVMVVHADDGLDELSIAAPTRVVELKDGDLREYEVCPEDVGLVSQSWEDLRVENSQESLALVKAALTGEHAAARDFVAFNAGAAIYVGGGSVSLAEGVERAKDSIASGAAKEKLNLLIEFTQQLRVLDP